MKKPQFFYYIQALFQRIIRRKKNTVLAELIKITSEDRKLPLPDSIKTKLNNLPGKKDQSLDLQPPLRLILDHADTQVNTNASRWLASTRQKGLYRVDLSRITSKYIGETEKNLANAFSTAQNKDWILFFDEADALFGKRTEVKDAHDKYANQEVSYLLKRIKEYNGDVIIRCGSEDCFRLLESAEFTSLHN